MIKRIVSSLTAVLVLLSVFSCSQGPDKKQMPAAVVNGEEISMESFQKRYKQRLEFHRKTASKVDEAELKKAVINEMISEKLLLDAAIEKGIEVNDEEVNKAIEQFKKREGKNLQEYLKRWNISDEEFKNEVKKQIMINRLLAKLVPEDSVSEDDIKEYYKNSEKPLIKPERVEVKLIQVLKEEDAKKAMEEIKRGKDFDELGEILKKQKKAVVTGYGWVQPKFFSGEIGDALKN
ncbi:MAG: hypothetical protein GXO99_07020, partial [Nitrospirae bacterium]|nr:hypothetical protein [Nitrospirota bacterium]